MFLDPDKIIPELSTILEPRLFLDFLKRCGEEVDEENYKFSVSKSCRLGCMWASRRLKEYHYCDAFISNGSVQPDTGFKSYQVITSEYKGEPIEVESTPVRILQEHSWIEYREFVIDLTLRQFDEKTPELACLKWKDFDKTYYPNVYNKFLITEAFGTILGNKNAKY